MTETFPKPRREAVLQIHIDFLAALCKAGSPRMARIVANPLPDDAVIVRCGYDEHGWLNAVVRSESFDPVDPMCEAPVLQPTTWCVEYAADFGGRGARGRARRRTVVGLRRRRAHDRESPAAPSSRRARSGGWHETDRGTITPLIRRQIPT